MALGVFICNKKWALYRINTHFLSLWVLILGIQDTPRFSEPRVGLLQGKVLRFFDPNVRSLAHFLADSVLTQKENLEISCRPPVLAPGRRRLGQQQRDAPAAGRCGGQGARTGRAPLSA